MASIRGVSGSSVVNLLQQTLDRYHVPVFHRNPERRSSPALPTFNFNALGFADSERLFAEDRHIRVEQIPEYGVVQVVWRRQDDRMQPGTVHHFAICLEAQAFRPCQAASGLAHSWIGVGDGVDTSAFKEIDVADVLLAHHSGADDSVTTDQFVLSSPSSITGKPVAAANDRRAGRCSP